jgi:prepilin-type N-terminal cleavage/methylation domain-containing protein
MHRKTGQRGMTLIEVMVALLVATVGILGPLALMGTLFISSNFSRSMTEASTLAQSKIEALNSQSGVTVLPPSPPNGLVTPSETGLDAYGNVVAGGPYTRLTSWSVTPDNQRRRIDVTVQWNDALGRLHSVTTSAERIP